MATRKWFHPVLAIRPVSLSFSVFVILFHFIMLANKFSNNKSVRLSVRRSSPSLYLGNGEGYHRPLIATHIQA